MQEGVQYDSAANPRQEALAKHEAMTTAAEDQILRADLDQLSDMLDKFAEKYVSDPHILEKIPGAAESLEAIKKRFRELTGGKTTH